MSEPIYEALIAQRRGDNSEAAISLPQEDLVDELEICADFADGTLHGDLVPLAHFMRHRIAAALRTAAAALRSSRAAPAPTGHLLDRVEDAIEGVLRQHDIDPVVKRPGLGSEWAARVAARAAIAETLKLSADTANRGIERMASERARQIHEEGHDPTSDVGRSRELMNAARCYLEAAEYGADAWHDRDGRYVPPGGWPLAPSEWKPSTDASRNLEIAGALTAAAFDAHAAEVALAEAVPAKRPKRRPRFT